MLALSFGCTTNTEAPQQKPTVKPTNTKVAALPVKKLENNAPPKKIFKIQNANSVAPENVIEEVDFGGQGGGGAAECKYNLDNKQPVLWYYTNEREWLEPIYIGTCGWEVGEQVEVRIQTPSKEIFTDIVESQYDSSLSFPYVEYIYQDTINSQQSGYYIFEFIGVNGTVEVSVNIQMPNESRMYFIEDVQAYYLYGFSPNEKVRFFWYEGERPRYQFKGWEDYYVDGNGRLLVEVDSNDGLYTVLFRLTEVA